MTIYSAAIVGLQAHLVSTEIDISEDKKGFFIVGLPDAIIRESGKRIATALKNSHINTHDISISINLAPAHLKKEGSLFDLGIAVAILQEMGYSKFSFEFIKETLFIGELSFNGSIKGIDGILVIADNAKILNKKRIIISGDNAQEASLVKDIEIIAVEDIDQLIAYSKNNITILPTKSYENIVSIESSHAIDFVDVKGQYAAKKALQIAAAGRHNLLFSGPPGSGKTMLAQRLVTIMPSMNFNEIIEYTKVYSISGKLNNSLIMTRPFRSPHHSSSVASLIGGGTHPKPGEISLAHKGILFLDELLEFKRDCLESLRQPLESKTVDISRVNYNVTYPCDFLLIAALNPCPCGYFGDKHTPCKCSPVVIKKYKDKLSGPLIDRIDIKVMVEGITYDESQQSRTSLSSEQLKEGVNHALHMQYERFGNDNTYNSQMNVTEIEKYCTMTQEAQSIIKDVFTKTHMSMRTYHKILKVARTIADIDQSSLINENHIKQAVIFKS